LFPGFGVNESCAEFGSGIYPGVLGTEYTWPDQAAMRTLRDRGMNTFRVAFSMERLVPNQLTGPADSAYMGDLKRVCQSFAVVNLVVGTNLLW
jgi:endoglucanase